MFQGKTLHVSAIGDGIAELRFDREGASVNKFDRQTIAELDAALDVIATDAGIRGVLVTSAKDSFIVGADIFEFASTFTKSETELAAFTARCASVFTRLSDLRIPSVAAVNGLALGGGFECALAADYRVMADTARVGLPEVSLGIFPGYGGTVRLPRVARFAAALDWIVSGAPQTADEAVAARAVDIVTPQQDVRATAITLLREAIAGNENWLARRDRQRGPHGMDAATLRDVKSALARHARHYPAGLAAVELIEASAALSRDAALREEARAFAKIARTQTAAALVGIFTNGQAMKKRSQEYARVAAPVRQAAVLGAGIMGGGIAYQSAARGTPVLLKDVAQTALDLGQTEARKLFDKQVASGRMSADKARAVLESIRPTLDYDGIEQADVVIEAVVENLAVKKRVLAEVEARCAPGAVIASNTSSLSIADLSHALERPQHFIGMHFFNPVPVMPLVEVIRGPRTSSATVAVTVAYAVAMGKTPVVVQDCPGFLINRILTAYILAFATLIHEGVDFETIDAAMESFGWPMGPAYLQDVIGMDTAAHVLEVVSAGYPARMTLPYDNAVAHMAALGRYGQKSGLGFYRYETDPRGKPKKLAADDTRAILRTLQPRGTRDMAADAIVDRMMLPVVIEAAQCLADGVAESAVDIDMALVLGVGFPRHVGGALRYADFLGLAEVVARCDRIASSSGLYVPTAHMRDMAANARTFF